MSVESETHICSTKRNGAGKIRYCRNRGMIWRRSTAVLISRRGDWYTSQSIRYAAYAVAALQSRTLSSVPLSCTFRWKTDYFEEQRVGMNPGSVLREYTFTSLHLRWPPLFVLLDSDRLVHYIIKTHHKFASFPTSWMWKNQYLSDSDMRLEANIGLSIEYILMGNARSANWIEIELCLDSCFSITQIPSSRNVAPLNQGWVILRSSLRHVENRIQFHDFSSPDDHVADRFHGSSGRRKMDWLQRLHLLSSIKAIDTIWFIPSSPFPQKVELFTRYGDYSSLSCRYRRHPFMDEPRYSRKCALQFVGHPLPISGSNYCPSSPHIYLSFLFSFSQTSVGQNGLSVTTMWRVLRPNREDRIARLEWSSNGGLGRLIMGRVTVFFFTRRSD